MDTKLKIGLWYEFVLDAPDTTLDAWISERVGHEISAIWKSEGRVGPLVLTDQTEARTRSDGKIGIPGGGTYRVSTTWISRCDAREIADLLGVILKVDG